MSALLYKVCVTVQEMRVGPSGSVCRGRLQSTSSCIGKEPLWWALRKRHAWSVSVVNQRDERKRTIRWGVENYQWLQNWWLSLHQDKSRGNLLTAWVGSGIKVAWIWFRLLHGTWEPVVLMTREKLKWRPHESESTDAGHGGGSSRISFEGPVMGMERRGWASSQ